VDAWPGNDANAKIVSDDAKGNHAPHQELVALSAVGGIAITMSLPMMMKTKNRPDYLFYKPYVIPAAGYMSNTYVNIKVGIPSKKVETRNVIASLL